MERLFLKMSSFTSAISDVLMLLKQSLSRPRNTKPQQQLPPSVEWLLQHRDQHSASTTGETPIASLYRMYEYIVLGYNTGLRTEIEWFFDHPDWAVSAIPNPNDTDPARYAILAVIPHFMCAAFNRLIERGLPRGSPAVFDDEEEEELRLRPIILEELPSWVANVPKLTNTLTIPDVDGSVPDAEGRSHQFLVMNIVVQQPHVMFV